MRFVPVTSIADALPLWFILQICKSFHVLYAAGSVIANGKYSGGMPPPRGGGGGGRGRNEPSLKTGKKRASSAKTVRTQFTLKFWVNRVKTNFLERRSFLH